VLKINTSLISRCMAKSKNVLKAFLIFFKKKKSTFHPEMKS
jgi:hypothetical protein